MTGRRPVPQGLPDSAAEPPTGRRPVPQAGTAAWLGRSLALPGCAALCALGATAGLTAVLHELSYHVPHASQAIGCAGVALCAGALLGLWLPRRIIHRHLRTAPAARFTADTAVPPADRPEAGPTSAGNELEFAAALSGSLILALGLTWLLPCLSAAGMEAYRAFLGRHFLFPPPVMRAAVLAPACLGLLLVGAAGTITLMSLRGWSRVCTPLQAGHAPLWSAGLIAAALGAGAMTAVTDKAVLIVTALLATFAAGLLAVYRPPRGAPTAEPPLEASRTTADLPALLVILAAAFSAALALILAFPDEPLTIANLGWAVAALAASVLLGLLAVQAVPRRWKPTLLAPLLLLASAAVWVFAYLQSPTVAVAGMGRLVGVACCTSACLGLINRRLAAAWGSSQLAFTHVGGLAVAAGSGALILGLVLKTPDNMGTLSGVVAVGLTAAAGLALVFDPRGSKLLRIGGLLAVAGWLGIVSWLGDFERPAPKSTLSGGTAVVETPAQRAARDLYEGPGIAAIRVCGQRAPDSPAVPSAWEIDLAGPRYAVVVIAPATENRGGYPDRRTGRRVVRRCNRSLARSGHLVFEFPAGELATAALDVARNLRADGWGSYLLRLSGPHGVHDVLLVGPDVPDWVRQHPWPDGFEPTLYEVPRRRDLARHLATRGSD